MSSSTIGHPPEHPTEAPAAAAGGVYPSTGAPPNIRIELPSAAHNVALVRETLNGLAEAIALRQTPLYDILTAVTEACNNVSLHAYAGELGPLEVTVRLTPGRVTVLVRDEGVGMHPQDLTPDDGEFRIGLPVIRALAQRVELRAQGRGTEVEMEFLAPAIEPLAAYTGQEKRPPSLKRAGAITDAVHLTIAPVTLANTILPRLLSMLASHADFSTDRISDVQLVADALAAHSTAAASATHLNLTVSTARHKLKLCLGPLIPGGAHRLVADSHIGGGLGGVIEKLADKHYVDDTGPHETLTLELSDRHWLKR